MKSTLRPASRAGRGNERFPSYCHCNENSCNESSYSEWRWQHLGTRMASRPSHEVKTRGGPPTGISCPRLILVGANHRTCPLDVREALVRRVTYAKLQRAGGRGLPWEDLILLSTCNRVEVYALTREPDRAEVAARTAFGRDVRPGTLYYLEDFQAAAHLFRVASGLDSVAQGERQVAEQVRRAPSIRPAALRRREGLATLFDRAAREAPRIRAFAGTDDPSASASHAAVRYIREVVPVPWPSVVLLGSGKMARLAAGALKGRTRITVLDRNPAKARTIAAELEGTARPFAELEQAFAEADVVLAATAAERPLVSERTLRTIAAARTGRPLWIVDLGVPRNVDPRALDIAEITYVDVDALGPWASPPPSPGALARAEARVHEEARGFVEGLRSRDEDAVAALRRAVEVLRTKEVEEALARLPSASEAERAVIDKLTSRLVNRLLHAPTRRLRELATGEREFLVRSFLSSWRDLRGDRE